MLTADATVPKGAAIDSNLGTPCPITTETLKDALLDLIEKATATEVQVEASRLMTCVVELGQSPDQGDLSMIASGLAALKAERANVEIAKFVRNRFEIAHRNRRPGLVPWISRKLSDSPVYAMLVGVLSSALIWVVAFGLLLTISTLWNRMLETNFILPPQEASPLAFAAFAGGLVSLLSRVDEFANLYIFDPFLVFLNSLLKPLIGTVLALTIYTILKSGLVQVNGIDLVISKDGYRYIFWAFGFVAGFSERLTGDFIARAETVVSRPREEQKPGGR